MNPSAFSSYQKGRSGTEEEHTAEEKQAVAIYVLYKQQPPNQLKCSTHFP